MSMYTDLFSGSRFIFFFAFRHGIMVLLALLLFALSTKRNKKGNLWLAWFTIFMGITLLNDNDVLGIFTRADTYFINRILTVPTLLLPAVFYFSVSFFVIPDKKLRKKDLLYVIPWGLNVLLLIPFLSGPELQSVSVFWEYYAAVYAYFIDVLFVGFSGFIIIKLFKKLKAHQRAIRSIHSRIGNVNLKWLYYLVLAAPVMLLAFILLALFDTLIPEYVGDTIFLFAMLYIGYYAVIQEEIFPFEKRSLREIREIVAPKATEKSQLLSEAESTALATALEQLMETEKPYLTNDISLPQLSELLQLRPHQLSFLLNHHFNENFYSYINTYRVAESKKILSNPEKDHLNMLGVAYESGFNSKTTFNISFKKITGISPSEYKKSLG